MGQRIIWQLVGSNREWAWTRLAYIPVHIRVPCSAAFTRGPLSMRCTWQVLIWSVKGSVLLWILPWQRTRILLSSMSTRLTVWCHAQVWFWNQKYRLSADALRKWIKFVGSQFHDACYLFPGITKVFFDAVNHPYTEFMPRRVAFKEQAELIGTIRNA